MLLLSCPRTPAPASAPAANSQQQTPDLASEVTRRAFPSARELSQMQPQDREKALEQLERNAKELPEPSRGIRLRFVARARAMARVSFGVNGEIVILSRQVVPHERDILLVRNEDGSARITQDPMDAASAFATISKNGDVKLAVVPKAGRPSMKALPVKWPFRDEKGNPATPEPGTLIVSRPEKGAEKIVMPPDAIGWLYVDIDHALAAPPRGLDPFPNVIWVYRDTDGGLRLVHSGPDEHGPFGTVSPEGKVTFPDSGGMEKPKPGEWYWWGHFSSEDSFPCMFPPEIAMPMVPGKADMRIMVDKFGNASLTVPGKIEVD